jgi:glycosyltransferase involved in cell wall biosynthesis
MPRCRFAVPGDMTLPTGGYAYDRRVLAALPAAGVAAELLELPGGYPSPSRAELEATARALAAVPADDVLLIDGLAYGAMPAAVVAAARAPIVALCHHPLGHEAGLDAERRAALLASEKAALALARAVVVTSATTAETLVGEFGVPRERLVIAEPGTDPGHRTVLPPECRLLAVGSIVPRKGYDVLVEALARLPASPDWSLTIVGAERDTATAEALRSRIAAHGLGQRITLAGAVDTATLDELYAGHSLFVLASHYEGYGMVLAEAMARGLPIVTTTGGAAAATVPDGAGLKVPPGDPTALAEALAAVITEPSLRARLAEASWRAGATLPRWSDTARIIADVIRKVAP